MENVWVEGGGRSGGMDEQGGSCGHGDEDKKDKEGGASPRRAAGRAAGDHGHTIHVVRPRDNTSGWCASSAGGAWGKWEPPRGGELRPVRRSWCGGNSTRCHTGGDAQG